MAQGTRSVPTANARKIKQFYSTRRAARDMIQAAIDDALALTEVIKRRADSTDMPTMCP